LVECRRLKAKSIAFPAIGTEKGFPRDKACEVALGAVRDFLNSEEGEDIDRVVFVMRYKVNTNLYRDRFR